MQLTEIGLVRFKAYQSATLKAAPFTVLIGPNNGGKSSVLQALALLAQTVASNVPGRIKTDGPIVDLGESVTELGNDSSDITSSNWEISLTWNAPASQPLVSASPEVQVGFQMIVRAQEFPQTLVTYAWTRRDMPPGRTVEARAAWGLAQPQPEMTVKGAEFGPTGGPMAPAVERKFRMNTNQPWQWQLGEQLPLVDAADVSSMEPDHIAIVIAYEAVPFLTGGIAHQLQAFHYVGPDRQVVRSVYPLEQGRNLNPQTAVEVVNELAFSDHLLSRVDLRLQQTFQYGLDKRLLQASQFRPAGSGALVALVGKQASRRRNLVNMGAGFSQFAWIALQVELAREFTPQYPGAPRPTPVIGVEEPELHLHPKLQPAMARLLADFVGDSGQVICTTQSEHFLLAVLELVLDKTLRPDQVAVYYLDAPNGAVDQLEVDEKAQLKGGLKGFFEENERQIERQIDLLRKSAGLDS